MSSAEALTLDRIWIAWTGMETDLIFNHGYDLRSFAAFPMLDSEEGRARLRGYYDAQIQIGGDFGVGIILDTPTWMANPDRALAVGYKAPDLPRVTRDGVSLARDAAAARADVAIRLSVQIGPRGDGYKPGIAAAETAARYHLPQIAAAHEAGADLVSAYTLGAAGEAIGISAAARQVGIPALIAFTIETDGRLADGTPLSAAVAELVEKAEPEAVVVNCAHPDHVASGLDGGPWQTKLAGIVANASRQSHAELDAAEALDDGNPEELAGQLAELRRVLPNLRVLGGCCGTDLRHLRAIAARLTAPHPT
ncbi:homocysteine S-methyltransferase family protein [Paracoccus sp. MBLB3053]|uniref:Homocysteine S-methyltransferase family protein n=1 Tax=Paracoccus aurantius TaxID=3073814 RepID=A0ABU2HYF9_9RHOB|nr:homocysteine S-methyltransferase family protein [Paracoccus sp. MBLB3053]MDS9470097.1 homocysteine S-methyltransferase family protein [Paracoccus sp. MBLB3053]